MLLLGGVGTCQPAAVVWSDTAVSKSINPVALLRVPASLSTSLIGAMPESAPCQWW
jgi:hypothetical protein